MNLGIISTPNTKGQIVIPKKYRDQLGITANTPLNIVHKNQGIFIYPLKNVSIDDKKTKEEIFSDILEKTKGAWSKKNWKKWEKEETKRKKLELKSSLKNQQQIW